MVIGIEQERANTELASPILGVESVSARNLLSLGLTTRRLAYIRGYLGVDGRAVQVTFNRVVSDCIFKWRGPEDRRRCPGCGASYDMEHMLYSCAALDIERGWVK